MARQPRIAGSGIGAALLAAALMGAPAALAGVNVTERGYDAFRTGANTAESVLTPAKVRSDANRFHKQFVLPVDGKIEGSPLYVSGVPAGGATHDVLYVATMHNTVFAFDADTGAQLGARWLGPPVTGNDLHALKPTTIHAEWGIAGTPAIDLATGTLYVVRWGYEEGVSGPTFRLFGLDIANLAADRFPSVRIDGFGVNGTGFDRYRQVQRAGLALAAKPDGAKALVIAFAGGEGQGSAAGWVLAYDTARLASGAPSVAAWCSNPNNGAGGGYGGGIWMANAAPAIDGGGDIYVATGNGPYNPQFGLDQLGESVVRLSWNPGDPGSLVVADWFTPFLDRDRDGAHQDQDLGSAGVIALPDAPGLIAGGKDGVYYHVSRAGMGRRDFSHLPEAPFVASFDYQPWNGHASLFDDLNQVTSTDPFTIGHVDRGRAPHIHGTGVYFNNLLFVHGENNVVHVFARHDGRFGPDPVARGTATASWGTPSPGGMPGGILALSANGAADGILWANEAFGNLATDPDSNIAPTPNILRAYDVASVAGGTLRSIWDSEAEPNDRLGAATKFAPPLIANGRVYQATYDNQVVVYGLGAPSATPVRDVRRTVIFIYARSTPGQMLFLRGGAQGGAPIRIRHRNWLNPGTNRYRWGDAHLDWGDGETGQARPSPNVGGGSPAEWTTSAAEGQGQPFVWTAGYGIADENIFGPHYWMLDVDMDCEQATDDGHGNRWFEAKAFMVTQLAYGVASTPGWEGDIAQASDPAPPYASRNHMGICGKVNVFVANYPGLPPGFDPNGAQFRAPAYAYPAPADERGAPPDALDNTPCVAPGAETRCLGNLAQTCQSVAGGTFFRTAQDCTATPAGGDFVQACQAATGRCCSPRPGGPSCWP